SSDVCSSDLHVMPVPYLMKPRRPCRAGRGGANEKSTQAADCLSVAGMDSKELGGGCDRYPARLHSTRPDRAMKFGTSGLRGLSTDLKGPASRLYAAAFGRYLLESGKAKAGDDILLGRDFRDSSPEIAANCAEALGRLGFRVIDCGTVPTPALALYGLENRAASLMVTGSHIPADRNGIKFYRPD